MTEDAEEERDRPADACAPDEPCEACGEPMGSWWGVTTLIFGPVGKMLGYRPIHSRCWWDQHPDAGKRAEERMAGVKNTYQLQKVEKPRPARQKKEAS